jgi:hypothetical protein
MGRTVINKEIIGTEEAFKKIKSAKPKVRKAVKDAAEKAYKGIKEAEKEISKGIDALIIPALTDLKECWYGIEIDKSKFNIVLDNVTEETVYLKIVHKKSYKERIADLANKNLES